MAYPAAQHLHQSPNACVPNGVRAWALPAGRAMGLKARHASELQVLSGCVWATLDGLHAGAANDSGDVFLNAGTTLRVPAGRRVVLEAMRSADGDAAQLRWGRVAPAYGFLAALRRALAGARAARAASNANRAQGAMACGESIASSGAL